MEGRGFSGLYKNTSEELFLKTVMESPIGMPVPTMDMLGFKTVSQSFRTDSEELFKRWLTNGEGYNSSSMGLNSRLSKRISTELANNVSNEQRVNVASEGRNNDKLYMQNNLFTNDVSGDINFQIRDPVNRELQSTSDLFLAKAWFLSDQRVTRSRSSELRRKYTEMQNAQTKQGIESMSIAPQHVDTTKQEIANFNGFDYITVCEIPSQKGSFMSPSNSSSSTFHAHQMVNADKVSSCVSMLKGTLQRKRLWNQVEKEAAGDSGLNGLFCPQEPIFQTGFSEEQENWNHQKLINVQGASAGQIKDPGVYFASDGFANQTNQTYVANVSREPSQSESSAAAPVISSGLDACEGPSNSNQNLCESSWKQVGVSRSSENTQNRVKGVREQIMDNIKDDRKRKSLERYGSVTSAVSEEKGDSTKKRRVERSRNRMAEAKERNLTPSVPSDMQTVLKRCENLEKEVRSLKLNLSFMNRKDSEQTKQIEDLQKQNEDLADEKERLLEEIERILSETGKI
ncbi:protein CYCLOPS-like isoform X1 [Vigna unguiculata]|uniref:protein CYCLOPS-like isoform X1 n=1 Tax=Vigna unguiculata TaxID=3917 RepID=UPI00101718EB|nr:protein CYCLOPS-like isoform X1 [Vigna unguiculata]XP_027913611.1 protein CYCLOPS-like isoform X1 [Vigna unguiculata]